MLNLAPTDAWHLLRSNEAAWLIDVRTPPELQYVGSPDLREAGGRSAHLPWHVWPAMTVNPAFVPSLERAIASRDSPVLFLCRSGGRSLAAARAAEEAGWPDVINILHGFEGDLDAHGQRNRLNGWKAAQLPWRQT